MRVSHLWSYVKCFILLSCIIVSNRKGEEYFPTEKEKKSENLRKYVTLTSCAIHKGNFRPTVRRKNQLQSTVAGYI